MVHIITDTTAGLPRDVAQRYGIPVIPQVINFGSDSYLEGIEIDQATFMQRLKTSRDLPKTAAPPPELFVQEFERLVPDGQPILCIHPSTDLSGTVRSALTAAEEFPGADIRVLDTRTIASPLATMVTLAAEWADADCDAGTIMTKLNALIPRSRIYFMVATLEYLARGGRIGGAAALLGGVLQLKPILALTDGRVEPFERVRTSTRAVARLQELVLSQMPRDGSGHLSVIHAAVPDQAAELVASLRRDLPEIADVPILDVPPAIVTHGGPGILGVGFFVAE
jgi:DegV family protein with EDD domain